MGQPWTALVVDEAVESAHTLVRALEAADAKVIAVNRAADVVDHLDEDIDVAIVSVGKEDGLSLLSHFRQSGRQTPVVMLSETNDLEARSAAFSQGCDDWLAKSIGPAELIALVQRRLEIYSALTNAQREAGRLGKLVATDAVTQLATADHFQQRLKGEFGRARRYDDPLALIFVALDHFKAEQAGETKQHLKDQIFVAVSLCMTGCVREADLVARQAGERFAVLLPKTQLAGALTVAERIANEMKSIKVGPSGQSVTCSLGLAAFPCRAIHTVEQLIGSANEALAHAQRDPVKKICLSFTEPPLPDTTTRVG